MLLKTERLVLRDWRKDDKAPFYQMSQDTEVMRYFPALLSREESDALADKAQGLISQNGYGFWAVERQDTGEFIGFVGLHHQPENSGIPNAPMTEIGWRIARPHWRQGFAHEAARKAMQFAFSELALSQLYAFTTLTNLPSQSLMRKLGMHNLNQDFNHPKLAKGHPLARHCLFSKAAPQASQT